MPKLKLGCPWTTTLGRLSGVENLKILCPHLTSPRRMSGVKIPLGIFMPSPRFELGSPPFSKLGFFKNPKEGCIEMHRPWLSSSISHLSFCKFRFYLNLLKSKFFRIFHSNANVHYRLRGRHSWPLNYEGSQAKACSPYISQAWSK